MEQDATASTAVAKDRLAIQSNLNSRPSARFVGSSVGTCHPSRGGCGIHGRIQNKAHDSGIVVSVPFVNSQKYVVEFYSG